MAQHTIESLAARLDGHDKEIAELKTQVKITYEMMTEIKILGEGLKIIKDDVKEIKESVKTDREYVHSKVADIERSVSATDGKFTQKINELEIRRLEESAQLLKSVKVCILTAVLSVICTSVVTAIINVF